MNPVPLTIITGFLGAGKTTLLNHILHSDHGLRIAVLVNDFGSVNIDSELVAATSVDGDMVSLSNGCICCTIRGDLLQAVENLFKVAEPPEYIVIETSGVSDPLEVALTFRDVPRMQALVRIDSIITVIDAEQFLDVKQEHAVLAMNQVGMADLVVLNKVDLVGESRLREVEKNVRHIMSRARIVHAEHGFVPLSLLLGVGHYDPQALVNRQSLDIHVHEEGDYHTHEHADHSMVFDTWTWSSNDPLVMKEIKRAVDRLPASVFRLKGIVQIQEQPDVRMVLHVVGSRITVYSEGTWETSSPTSQIVAIAARGGIDHHLMNELFDGCLVQNAPRSELERLARGVISWLRPV